MSKTTIRMCPYCGEQPYECFTGYSYDGEQEGYAIVCKNRECPVQPFVSYDDERYRERAINEWNKRQFHELAKFPFCSKYLEELRENMDAVPF